MTDDIDVQPEDALEVAQRALAKINELEQECEDRADRVAAFEEELTSVKLRLSEIDDDRDYEALTTDEKVGMVREHAFQKAADGHGRAKLDYSAIKWEVFDGEPGNNHCYRLMRLAAGNDDDEQTDFDAGAVGFKHCDPDDGNQHLAVNAERAKRSPAFYSRNKTATEGERAE